MTAPDVASVHGGAKSERPRRTRTGPDGVDPSQVLDIGAIPEIAGGSHRSPFPPIADYAFLSDCETTCLISSAGSVEWLCVPRPDSPSVFGALLDRSAGHFRLGPKGAPGPGRTPLSAGQPSSWKPPGRPTPDGSSCATRW